MSNLKRGLFMYRVRVLNLGFILGSMTIPKLTTTGSRSQIFFKEIKCEGNKPKY